MTTVFAGAVLDRQPGPQYRRALRFAEIALRAPLPKANTLGKWRVGLPEEFTMSLIAPKSCVAGSKGPLRFDDALEAQVKWLDDAATALDARFIVIPTGSDLTTGQRDRDLLSAYVDKLRTGKSKQRDIVWAPVGLWEPALAAKFATRLGILYAFDPIDAPVPLGKTVYGRLAAVGHRSRFNETLLREVHEAIVEDDIEEAFVAIDSPRSFQEASRLQQLVDAPGDGDDFDDDEAETRDDEE